ncbi:hypothetical protein MBLNU459_g2508t2 [Dothideomycetes sp. NU459]
MAQKHEFLIILPDQQGALERRMSVRTEHLKNVKDNASSGFWLFGGATLEDVPKEGEGLKINGSVMLASAESKEEVLEKLKADVYAKGEVWNFEKIQIIPFKSAIRSAL